MLIHKYKNSEKRKKGDKEYFRSLLKFYISQETQIEIRKEDVELSLL